MIRKFEPKDIEQVTEIYNFYILNSIATFEMELIDAPEMLARIIKILNQHDFLVYEQKGKVMGYAYSSKWNDRAAYKQSVESTIYLDPELTGEGIGTQLYRSLLELLKDKYHTVIAGISLPNAASEALHLKLGYEKASHYREVGYKFDKWIDVAYYQKML